MQRAIPPGHGRGRLDDLADHVREPLVFGVDVLDAEFDDHAAVVGCAGRSRLEPRDRARAANRQRA